MIIEIIKNRLEKLSRYLIYNKKVKMHYGEAQGNPENKDFDEREWETIGLPYTWDTQEEIWFRKEITVPNDVQGIPVGDSSLEIGGSGYFSGALAIAHGELFIDGNKVFEAQNWTDFRYRYSISSEVGSGDKHLAVIHFFKGNDYFDTYPRYLNPLEIHLSKIDDVVFEIQSFLEEMRFCRFLPGGENALSKSLKDIDIEEINNCDYSRLLGIFEIIRNSLKGLSKEAKKYRVKLIGHAHIDMNWLWPMSETEDVVRDTFGTVLKLMKNHTQLHFSQSQAQTYKIAEDKYPDMFEDIKKMAAGGRWDITASTWVELDLNLSDGESIVRQILYAREYIKQKFDFEPRVFWSPDTFGHPLSIPQILKKSGLDYYFFMRASYRDDDLFWWQGIDGSKVLAFNSRYIGEIDITTINQLVKHVSKTQDTRLSMYVYGIGDHGGGPTVKDIEATGKINSKALLPELEFSTTHDYFDSVIKEKPKIPVRPDELNPLCDGCYTTHWDTKVHNRECERKVMETETLGAVAKILNGRETDLERHWKVTLFNQFHDILPGSGVKPAYDYSNKIAFENESELDEISATILEEIGSNIKIGRQGKPLVVFNSLAWQRSGIVSLDINSKINENILVKDGNGKIVPSQILEGKLIFIVQDIPSLGYTTFYLTEETDGKNTSSKPGDIRVVENKGPSGENNYVMENEFFTLNIDKYTGVISYLFDKRNQRLVMKLRRDEGAESDDAFPKKFRTKPDSNSIPLTGVTMNNLLQVLYEKPHRMSAWVIGPISRTQNLIDDIKVELIASGPVVGTVRIKHSFNSSTIVQDINVYREIDRIDFNTTIDWGETSDKDSDGPMLKASFTPILKNTTARYEIPFGSIQRVADGREYPALNWVDISDDDYGLSLLSDTKYGFDIMGNTARITLIRTSHEPDPDPDRGKHSFIYSIYPHSGDFDKCDTVRKGYELNRKLIPSFIDTIGGGESEEERSFVKVSAENVILSAFKAAQDGNGLIIRVYESKGKKVKARIDLGFKTDKVEEVNLIEEKIKEKTRLSGNGFDFEIAPFEIKTFRISLV